MHIGNYVVTITGMEGLPLAQHYHKTQVQAEAMFNVWLGLVSDGVAERVEVLCLTNGTLLHESPEANNEQS
jgi:hypothetical protein